MGRATTRERLPFGGTLSADHVHACRAIVLPSWARRLRGLALWLGARGHHRAARLSLSLALRSR